MSYKNSHYVSVFVPSVLLGFIAALQLAGCSDSPPGLPGEAAGAGGQSAQGGAEPTSAAGSDETGEAGADGENGEAAGGAPGHPEGGGNANGGTTEGGGGSTASGGGIAGGGDAGALTSAGTGGTLGEAVIPTACMFHTDASLSAGGAGGTGGAGGMAGTGGTGGTSGTGGSGPALTVTVQVSPFVGTYLADATGRTLYTYGNDLPGDCNTPPVSNCVTDCLISWPIFPANARVLAAGLDDAAFGAIHRDDGTWQTTYYGWPIYYYKTDLLLGQVAGQGKAKTWHIATQKPAGVMIMKPGSLRYLSDASGHTLYVSAADQAGTASSDPVSNCTGDCLGTFEPFHEKNFSVVTSLLMSDFGSFVRTGNGKLQVAYKGLPLYRAATDLKSGDMTGTSVTGFTAALP
ncbi:MAG: hypothetical protein WDO69_25640 [Pseudomonadota bacterium]